MEMLVFGIAAAVSYWYETEVFLFLGSAYVTCRFLYKWYMPLLETWHPMTWLEFGLFFIFLWDMRGYAAGFS